MKTLVVKIDLDSNTSMVEDYGPQSWDETKMVMDSLVEELRFYKKKPIKPRAVRLGKTRIVIVGFREP